MQMTIRPLLLIGLLAVGAGTNTRSAHTEIGQSTDSVDVVLRGRVADAGGCPLSEVDITITTATGTFVGSTKTDTTGEFRINKLRKGRVTVRASLVGFQNSEQSISLSAGDNLWDTGLVLGRITPSQPHKISGQVTDVAGTQVPNATITLFDAFSGARRGQTRSDREGNYALDTYDVGQYVVTVAMPGYLAVSTAVDFRFDDAAAVRRDFRLSRSAPCSTK